RTTMWPSHQTGPHRRTADASALHSACIRTSASVADMKNTSLTRSTSYWLLLALSLAATAIGGWLVWDSTTTMLTTILAGTATNVEVYVGQAWITSGAALLAAGIVGIFLSLVFSAVK